MQAPSEVLFCSWDSLWALWTKQTFVIDNKNDAKKIEENFLIFCFFLFILQKCILQKLRSSQPSGLKLLRDVPGHRKLWSDQPSLRKVLYVEINLGARNYSEIDRSCDRSGYVNLWRGIKNYGLSDLAIEKYIGIDLNPDNYTLEITGDRHEEVLPKVLR